MNTEIIGRIFSENNLQEVVKFSVIPMVSAHSFEFAEVTIHNKSVKFAAKYKTEPRLMHLPSLKAINKDIGPILLVANYISNPIKEELRKAKINYIDAAGNIYIDKDPILIYIDGQKRQNSIEEKKNRAFTKTGLRIVFGFLQDPELINLPYRTIAEKMDVALDTVHYVINGLKELGYLLSVSEKKLTLTNTRQLLIRWIQEYDLKLKRSLFIGSFRFANKEDIANWEQIKLDLPETQWGGEPAGALITKFLRPEEYTIYTSKKRVEVMKELKLLPDANGSIKLYRKFWIDTEDRKAFVPEILIYADLLNHGDPRNAEIAQRIDEQYLQDRFK